MFEILMTTISGLFAISNGLILFFVKRYFSKKDKMEKERNESMEKLFKNVKTSLETIRLLSYHRMSEEIERLLNKGFATPAERRVLDEMRVNYKEHGWNGDMDARLEKVYALRTDRPESK